MTLDDFFSDRLTDAQRLALRRLADGSGYTVDEIVAQALYPVGAIQDYVAVPDYHGMYIGIEPDGYTHS